MILQVGRIGHPRRGIGEGSLVEAYHPAGRQVAARIELSVDLLEHFSRLVVLRCPHRAVAYVGGGFGLRPRYPLPAEVRCRRYLLLFSIKNTNIVAV